MRQRNSIGILLLVLTALTGCFQSGGGSAKDEVYYLLTSPSVPVERSVGPRIAVREFSVAPGYDSNGIAYRSQNNELRYWGYHRWVAEPAKLLSDNVIRHLRASGRFSAVEMDGADINPVGELIGQVAAIEENDTPNSWNARLAINFQLRDPDSDRVLMRYAFDESRPCSERHPRAIALAISQILAEKMNELSQRIASTLTNPASEPASPAAE